jgi:hypothetical protein
MTKQNSQRRTEPACEVCGDSGVVELDGVGINGEHRSVEESCECAATRDADEGDVDDAVWDEVAA